MPDVLREESVLVKTIQMYLGRLYTDSSHPISSLVRATVGSALAHDQFTLLIEFNRGMCKKPKYFNSTGSDVLADVRFSVLSGLVVPLSAELPFPITHNSVLNSLPV